MKTPIYDFVRKYAESDSVRLHMPGHKGQKNSKKRNTGCEIYDITEISGADSLYEAEGIIKKSEDNASKIFGAPTFYSTEGSSLAIRAMLYLCSLYAAERGERPYILAARNAHKTFVSAAVLLDFDLEWIMSDSTSYLSCPVDAERLRERFSSAERLPTAVYLTSPDYLGNVQDIEEIARACHDFDVLLLVDNAHGAYLKFLSPSRHPIDLGADVCCDSAHKTLSVLTGGAYLHVSDSAPCVFKNSAKDALALFGSTSPSYLVLSSLDLANDNPPRIDKIVKLVADAKNRILKHGYTLIGDEALKITLYTKSYGYRGDRLSDILAKSGIYAEFADPDYLVFMLSEENTAEDIVKLVAVLTDIPKREPLLDSAPLPSHPMRVMSPRSAMLSPMETVDAYESLGRILATPSVGCPPAVPIVVSGERIDEAARDAFVYYGINSVAVVKE